MLELLNTLYILTEGSYAHLDHDTIKIQVNGETKLRLPLLNFGSIVCFGNVLISPALMSACAEDGRAITFLSTNGKYLARIEGSQITNALLRHTQHQRSDDAQFAMQTAKNCVAGKMQNSRSVIMRAARESGNADDTDVLRETASVLAEDILHLQDADSTDAIRGFEGFAAQKYFSVFDTMVKVNNDQFRFEARTRRPPLNPVNALLSFSYTLLLHDCISALCGVGLDPLIGFLHTLRPGRPALALDLMEEFRPIFADRLALTLINRQQITAADFIFYDSGAVYLNEKGRKTVIAAYQKRKQANVHHFLLQRELPLGLVPHIQARLLARTIRGDMAEYPPYVIQ